MSIRDSVTSEGRPELVRFLAYYAIFGCVAFAISILIADWVVPNHDWIADTISDLGAGKYEFIVDIGIYSFSGSLIAIALLSAHVHWGGRGWSLGIVGFAILGLIVFLVGARNEYGDSDNEGVVIHQYLVYVLGFLFAVLPWLMSSGIREVGRRYATTLIAFGILWTIAAPVFFFLPTDMDGIYERFLGLIAFAIVVTMALAFLSRLKHAAVDWPR